MDKDAEQDPRVHFAAERTFLAWIRAQPCPADKTNRSRSGQLGSCGLNLSDRSQRAYAMDAEPMGKPGWPELAFCTMSTARKRSVLMHSSSSAGGAIVGESVVEDVMECFALDFFKTDETSRRKSRLTVAPRVTPRYILRPMSLHSGCLHWQVSSGVFFASAHVSLQ